MLHFSHFLEEVISLFKMAPECTAEVLFMVQAQEGCVVPYEGNIRVLDQLCSGGLNHGAVGCRSGVK